LWWQLREIAAGEVFKARKDDGDLAEIPSENEPEPPDLETGKDEEAPEEK